MQLRIVPANTSTEAPESAPPRPEGYAGRRWPDLGPLADDGMAEAAPFFQALTGQPRLLATCLSVGIVAKAVETLPDELRRTIEPAERAGRCLRWLPPDEDPIEVDLSLLLPMFCRDLLAVDPAANDAGFVIE